MLKPEALWTADQLRVMRGLDIPAWVGQGLQNLSAQAEVLSSKHMADSIDISPNNLNLPAPEHITHSVNVVVSAEQSMDTQVIDSAVSGQLDAVDVLATERGVTPNRSELSTSAIYALDWAGIRSSTGHCQRCNACEQGARLTADIGSTAVGGSFWVLDHTLSSGTALLSNDAQVLFNAILSSVGFGLQPNTTQLSALATSALKCVSKAKTFDVFDDSVLACTPYLQRQIVLKQPHIIIAMGLAAAQTLLAVDASLDELRGELHDFECEGYQGQVLVTYHPQQLLDDASFKRQVWSDLGIAIEAGLMLPPVLQAQAKK